MCRNLDGRKKMEYMEHFLLKLKPVLILIFIAGIDRSTAVHWGEHSDPAFHCDVDPDSCIELYFDLP